MKDFGVFNLVKYFFSLTKHGKKNKKAVKIIFSLTKHNKKREKRKQTMESKFIGG